MICRLCYRLIHSYDECLLLHGCSVHRACAQLAEDVARLKAAGFRRTAQDAWTFDGGTYTTAEAVELLRADC